MLTMLAVVHWTQKKLPERRNELYEEAVKYLLESRKDHSRYPALQRREALQALALAMFTDEEGVQRTYGLLEAGKTIAPLLQAPEAEARAFLDEESLQSGLLVSRTEGEVEFWHLSFQEYLAALELAAGGEFGRSSPRATASTTTAGAKSSCSWPGASVASVACGRPAASWRGSSPPARTG